MVFHYHGVSRLRISVFKYADSNITVELCIAFFYMNVIDI